VLLLAGFVWGAGVHWFRVAHQLLNFEMWEAEVHRFREVHQLPKISTWEVEKKHLVGDFLLVLASGLNQQQ
jgi:hypothetical protein